MKRKLPALSRRYEAALQKHVKQGARASLQAALSLGRQAAALRLKTLELARVHDRALATLGLSHGKNRLLTRADTFFNEALTPLVETHRAARRRKMDLNRLNETLGRRTTELASMNRQLQRGILRRKSGEAALKKSGKHFTRLLKGSLQLQEDLRKRTHQDLLAQEKDRLTISHQLQDEIAQTLLGINVRLLSLKTAAKGGTNNLRKEIASAQRLVEVSIRSINRFAHELDIHQPA